MSPRCIIIAGPNGSGKTTFARAFLPKEGNCPVFINADLIAAGLSPFQPESAAIQAGRLMLRHMDETANRGQDFAFETTLSGLGYIRRIKEWKAVGYRIHLVYLKLSSPKLAFLRVAQRVRAGGHSIPPEVILRRFYASWNHFQDHYQGLADTWEIYDNSGVTPRLLEASP
jgi:predicted ABC-type ATPase